MKFSYNKIESYCNEMNNISSKIRETLEDITNNLNRLENSDFYQGKSHDYYCSRLREITNNFEEVNYNINNNIKYLKQTAESYNTLDKRIISYVSDFFAGE